MPDEVEKLLQDFAAIADNYRWWEEARSAGNAVRGEPKDDPGYCKRDYGFYYLCPLAALCHAKGLVSRELGAYNQRLGVSHAAAWIIIRAADSLTDHNPEVRKRLYEICFKETSCPLTS